VPQGRGGRFSTELFERYQLRAGGGGDAGRNVRELRSRAQHHHGHGAQGLPQRQILAFPSMALRWTAAGL
jgi:hypothetical protein